MILVKALYYASGTLMFAGYWLGKKLGYDVPNTQRVYLKGDGS